MRFTGALYLMFLGMLLCVSGGGFTWLMWRSYERASTQRGWENVSCRILESKVVERKIGETVPLEYSHGLLYGYEIRGERYSSSRLTLRGASWSHAPDRALALVETYPAGSEQRCYVDPNAPEEAVLKLDSKAPGYSLWFPLLIVAGGLGIISGGVRNLLRAKGAHV